MSLPEYELGGLNEQDSSLLLEHGAADLPVEVLRRILDTAIGNPLALIELPLAARNLEPDRHALPLTVRLEQAFAARLPELEIRERTLLLVAALEDGEPGLLCRAAATALGVQVDVRAWDAIKAAGFGTLKARGFEFRHPLVRSAVEQSASAEEQRAAHAALASVLAEDLDRSVWHLADAAGGEDETVAAALADAAERARARGSGDVARSAIERSATLTPDPGLRALRLWEAANLAWNMGRWQEGLRLFADARQFGLPPFETAVANLRLESVTGALQFGAATIDAFTDVVEGLLAEGDHQRALEALETIAVRAYWSNLDEETQRRASATARKVRAPPDNASRLCFLAHVDPIRNGREVLNELSRLSPAGIGDADDFADIGVAATAVWADDVALPFLRAAADRCRVEGRLGPLAVNLASEAWAHVHRGAALPALTTAAESRRLADEIGWVLYVQAAKLAEAVALAQRGQDEGARALLGETEAVLLPLGATPLLPFVALARGRVELASGHYGDAYQRLIRVFDRDDVTYNRFLQGHLLADLVEAAVGSQADPDLVRRYLGDWEQIAAETGAPYLAAQVAYAAAVLDESGGDDRLFSAAIAASRGWDFLTARARCAYGVWLRRTERRASDARAPLREAAETFVALGQEAYAERALSELRASGETARRRVPETWADLTPQELQIAQLAAQGLSNKQIGERLFLSHRTVGTHLYHVFPKLGIAARGQLREALKTSTGS